MCIKTFHFKREASSGGFYGKQSHLLIPVRNGCRFGPSSCNIGHHKRMDIAAFNRSAAMGYQICFDKDRLGLIPVKKGSNGDVALKQIPTSRGRKATYTITLK